MNWNPWKKRGIETSQDAWNELSSQDVGPKTMEILNVWVSTLPESAYGIIDMAAGQGFEARYLDELGYSVTAFDRSRDMIRGSVYPVKHGDMTNIRLARASYSGILVKDAWVFLDHTERVTALQKFYASLVHSGSVLILSQFADTRAHIIPNESKLPIKVIRSDFKSDKDWMAYVTASTNDGGEILSIEYQTDYSSLSRESNKAGFRLSFDEYPYNSDYSQENRWVTRRNQLVAKLTK